jgi:hypothetical protein
VTTLEKLLEDAVPILGLSARAEKIFAEDGTAIHSTDAIFDQATLVISTGEPFQYSPPSPNSLRARYGSPPPKARTPTSPLSPPSPKSPDAPRLTRRQREHQAFQRLVATAPRSAQETMKLATAAVYDALAPEQKAQLGVPGEMERAVREVQEGLFQAHLYREGITAPAVEDGVLARVVDLFTRLPLCDVRFVVAGPRQSGKTALLHTMAMVLNRKLQLSGEAGRCLVFALNFEMHTLHVAEPAALLRLFVHAAFDALEYSALRLVPLAEGLRRWFLLSVFGSAASPPVCAGFDAAPLQALARAVAAALAADGDRALEDFLRRVAAFPREFALALGFTDVLFVLDSFEFAGVSLAPGPGLFPRALRGCNFADCLCAELSAAAYVVAMQNEQDFMETFSCADAALVDTQGFVEPGDLGVVEVAEPSLMITAEDCGGCPGFIGRFRRLADDVRRTAENAAIPSQFSDLKTFPDISRRRAVKLGLLRLGALLCGAKNEKFSLELLNRLGEVDDVFATFVPPRQEEEEQGFGLMGLRRKSAQAIEDEDE